MYDQTIAFIIALSISTPIFFWTWQYYDIIMRVMTYNAIRSEKNLTVIEETKTKKNLRLDQLYETKYAAMYQQLTSAYQRGGSEKEDGEKWIQEKCANLVRNYIIESTPNGNCIIRFNADLQVFEYFSDRVMPFRFLESVGQKYVRMFFCKPVYIDLKKALDDADQRKLELIEAEKEEAKISNVNIDLLRQRRGNNVKRAVESGETARRGPSASALNCEVNPQYRTLLDKNNIRRGIKTESNSYIWKGPFANFSVQPNQRPDEATADNSVLRQSPQRVAAVENISFADFMKIQKQNQK